MQPSEVIQAALNSGKYLSGEQPHKTNYLCSVISYVLEVSDEDRNNTHAEIHKALGHYSFLRRMLEDREVIPVNTLYGSHAYKQAATEFWQDLIAELKDNGK